MRSTAWPEALESLLQTTPSGGCLLLTFATDEKLRLDVLLSGGYDVALKPLHLSALTLLVNGYWTLRQELALVGQRTLEASRNAQQA